MSTAPVNPLRAFVRLLCSMLIGFLCSAAAHHPGEAVLPDGIRLCIDAESVSAAIDGSGEGRYTLDRGASAALSDDVFAMFAAFDGVVASDGSCSGAEGYVRLELTARYLDPARYRNFPDSTYSVRTSLRVGPREALLSPDMGTVARAAVFGLVSSELHSETDTSVPVHVRMTRDGRIAAAELAESYAATSRPRSSTAGFAVPMLGGGLLTVVFLCASTLIRRRLSTGAR